VIDPSAPVAATAPVRPPDPPALFERRAARLATLAEGHAAPEWLRLLARLARGQGIAVREIRPSLRARGDPPLPPLTPLDLIPGDTAWRRMLDLVLDAVRDPALPAPAQDAIRTLSLMKGGSVLEPLAFGVLAIGLPPSLVSCAPFVGAALQAWLAALAAGLGPGAPGREGECPACGGPPVAGVIGAEDRLRWLSCAWCATSWNVPRVRCVACETATGPEYLQLDPHPGAKAEACPDCRAYVKLFDLAKRPGAEPAADDAATIALDLLLAEEGFRRTGPNVYVGAGETS
jgi:FdhE protein